MVFASHVFLYLFLPVFLAVYYLVPFRWRSAVMVLFSYVFYGWWRPDFLVLLWFSTLLDYGVGKQIVAAQGRGRSGAGWLWMSVGVNLGLLAYFKYANWGIETLNTLLEGLGLTPFAWAPVLLPVGISFYTFQTMSYTIDLYRKEVPPARSLLDFASYVTLFPQLVAGPIVRYATVAHELVHRTHSLRLFSMGALRFMGGFCKKVLVADPLAPLVDAAFALPEPSLIDAWLGALAYTLQLYFDFSAYSDMAIGLGLMLGFHFLENFNHPYISRSVTEFWRRWHISLSTWLRDYLYIPLGGNRLGERRTYLNLMLTMLLGGIWHGASWNFVLWGLWHGSLLALERLWRARGGSGNPGWLPTLLLVMVGWVMFRAPDVGSALRLYQAMLGFSGLGLSDGMHWQVTGYALLMLGIGLVWVLLSPRWQTPVEPGQALLPSLQFSPRLLWLLPLFGLALLRLSAQRYVPFLYFQF